VNHCTTRTGRSQTAQNAPAREFLHAAYGINKENFGRDREGLEQDAENIINFGEANALRALTPEKIAAAFGARPARMAQLRCQGFAGPRGGGGGWFRLLLRTNRQGALLRGLGREFE
jgi:hypothetical protein